MRADLDLTGLRVLGALNGAELFGHERGNIEVFKVLRQSGAVVCLGINELERGGAVGVELHRLGFETFPVPFGFQWSKAFFSQNPGLILTNMKHVWRCNRVFASKLRQFRPTHVHLGSALAYSFLSHSLRRLEVPLVARLGDAPPFQSAVQMAIWRRFIRTSRVVVANSRYVWKASAAALSKVLGSRPPTIIHNLAPSGVQDEVRAPYDPAFRHIVFVGQIARPKGVFEFVRAAALLALRYPALRFHLVGGSLHSKPAEEELRGLIAELRIAERMTLHGWVNNVRDFLARADVHVAPSVWEEPFANVVLEAKREGIPSVVFASGGLPEMICHQVNGFICRDKTPQALAEGIDWVLKQSPDAGRALREAVARDHHQRFGEQRFREAWARVYRAAL